MSFEIVTGYTGTPHVTAQQDRYVNQGAFGNDSYILPVGERFAASIISTTQVKVLDGTLSLQGCIGVLSSGSTHTFSVSGGATGSNQNKLICAVYRKSSGIESMSLEVVAGPLYSSSTYSVGDSTFDPTTINTTSRIEEGATVVHFPLWRICFAETSLDSLVRVATVLAPLSDLSKLTTLSVEYVSNTYVDITSIARLKAFKKGGVLFLVGGLYINTSMPTGTTAEQIATITGWNACSSIYADVPGNGGSGTIGVNISAAGAISVGNSSGTAAVGYHRFTLSIPAAE